MTPAKNEVTFHMFVTNTVLPVVGTTGLET